MAGLMMIHGFRRQWHSFSSSSASIIHRRRVRSATSAWIITQSLLRLLLLLLLFSRRRVSTACTASTATSTDAIISKMSRWRERARTVMRMMVRRRVVMMVAVIKSMTRSIGVMAHIIHWRHVKRWAFPHILQPLCSCHWFTGASIAIAASDVVRSPRGP